MRGPQGSSWAGEADNKLRSALQRRSRSGNARRIEVAYVGWYSNNVERKERSSEVQMIQLVWRWRAEGEVLY